MKPPTTTYFFLGANSESGFYSLYDQFCSDSKDILHIIKGGPGTGKSTFMRQIGKAAESRGMDVEYILCSGDPNSLDGVYIPALGCGWADGTSPHILEPRHFGTDGVYENLGRFCKYKELNESHEQIARLTENYRSSYQSAYGYLHAAAAVRRASVKQIPMEIEEKIRKRARSKIKRELHTASHNAKPAKRFIQAISCTGMSVVNQTLNTLCSRLCILESLYGLEQIFFDEIQKELITEKSNYVLCPNPLCPTWISAIILPQEELCFCASDSAISFHGTTRTIHLDSYLPKQNKAEKHLYNDLLSTAILHLKHAKLLHDELELCYRPALDMQALSEYTQTVIDQIF